MLDVRVKTNQHLQSQADDHLLQVPYQFILNFLGTKINGACHLRVNKAFFFLANLECFLPAAPSALPSVLLNE